MTIQCRSEEARARAIAERFWALVDYDWTQGHKRKRVRRKCMGCGRMMTDSIETRNHRMCYYCQRAVERQGKLFAASY